ncbi:hypothetical protein OG941_50855 [Streptomyces sp. NBC_00147]
MPLTDQDLTRLPLATRHVVAVLGFVPGQASTRSRTAGRTTSAPAADRPYALLVEALDRTGQVGVCKVAVRSRERIALLRPRHGVILQKLLWQDERRDLGDLARAHQSPTGSSAPIASAGELMFPNAVRC